jgi:hypothetical protein
MMPINIHIIQSTTKNSDEKTKVFAEEMQKTFGELAAKAIDEQMKALVMKNFFIGLDTNLYSCSCQQKYAFNNTVECKLCKKGIPPIPRSEFKKDVILAN